MTYDIAIIGGGIVGLATARAILDRSPRTRLVLLEKETAVAHHQTGHNSGVIHSGIYYKPGSYKARLCVEGARLMKAYCEKNGIEVDTCGKVIVATSQEELPRLKTLYERGVANGVPGVAMIDARRLKEIEPHASALAGIHSPQTAIVDYRLVAETLARDLVASGLTLERSFRVGAITRERGTLCWRSRARATRGAAYGRASSSPRSGSRASAPWRRSTGRPAPTRCTAPSPSAPS